MVVLRRSVPLGRELVRLGDVGLLCRLVASAQQEHHAVAALCVVDPVAGPVSQPKSQDALADRLEVAGVPWARRSTLEQDPQASLPVLQLAQPPVKSSAVKTSTICRL
jgi:hypothetical protein